MAGTSSAAKETTNTLLTIIVGYSPKNESGRVAHTSSQNVPGLTNSRTVIAARSQGSPGKDAFVSLKIAT
jgi:hypothetical protein